MNPLSLTDPTGYSWLSKAFHSIGHFFKKWAGTIISVVFTCFGMPFVGALISSLVSAAINGGNFGSFVTGLVVSAVAGAIGGGIGGKVAGLLGAGGSSLLSATVRGAIIGGFTGGISSSIMGGSFTEGFAVGAVTGAATAAVMDIAGDHPVQEGSRGDELEHLARSTIGKLWTSVNTAVGLVWGGLGDGVGKVLGTNPGMNVGHNGIEFFSNPFAPLGSITIGNVMIHGGDPVNDPEWKMLENGSLRRDHEEQHTYQAELLGPLYLPSNILGGVTSILGGQGWENGWLNWNENGPNRNPPVPWAWSR